MIEEMVMKYIKAILFAIIFIYFSTVYSSENTTISRETVSKSAKDNGISSKDISKVFWEDQLLVSATVKQLSDQSCLLVILVYNGSNDSLFTIYAPELFDQFKVSIIEVETKKSVPFTAKGKVLMASTPISSIITGINAKQQKKYQFELTEYYDFTKEKSYNLSLSGSYTRNKKTIKFHIDNLIFVKQ